MDIIDLALQFKDYDWAKELLEEKYQKKEPEIEESLITLFDKVSIALDSLATQYAVKEHNGIRSFNINSFFDRNEAELVLVEKPPYAVGDAVKYYIPTKDELTYMRGTVNGYHMGYRDAYSAVNRDYALLYSAFNKTCGKKAISKKSEKDSGKTANIKKRKENNQNK